jgi:predicted nucleic acid-binding protein
MRYLFDPSSIYRIAFDAETAKKLVDGCTCSLVRYELGNILIKETRIKKTIDESEQKRILQFVMRALDFMHFIALRGDEVKIIEVGMKYGLTFYDATYVYAAKKASAILVTEDEKLAKKVADYIKTTRAAEVVQYSIRRMPY